MNLDRMAVRCLGSLALGFVVAAAACGGGSEGKTSGDSTSQTGGGGASSSATGGAGGTGGAGSTGGAGGGPPSGTPNPMLSLPPANGTLDYQLGGAYPPPTGVTVVSRDRLESPAAGIYNICYVNGFQIQPGDESWWLDNHPTLVLRDQNGNPIIDQDWDEMLLDVGSPDKRDAIAAIVGDWIAGCGSDDFDAVEIDNLDSYSRSQGLLIQDDAVAFMTLLSARAHAEGLAIAQKNSTELLPRKAELGTDFAVAEECNRYDECQDYVDVYGDLVFVIEYRTQDFDKGCSGFPNLSIVLRDLDLVTPGDGGYVYDAC